MSAFQGWFVENVWYGASRWRWVLLPLSWLFGLLIASRRYLYRRGILATGDPGCPVVVVGNITVGGTGKTPVTLWLAEALKSRGLKPGIVSRGYGGRVGSLPRSVNTDSNPAVVGDEPLLMARRVVCPVVVHPDRVAAVMLLADMGCDVAIADDGLQHYRLKRQYEIAVIDGTRGFGNGALLPAGPLREPVARLGRVDRILIQSAADTVPRVGDSPAGNPNVTRFELVARAVHHLGGTRTAGLEDFAGKRVHAVAAIGNPRRFFDLLERHGLEVIPHVFGDHAVLSRTDFEFGDDRNVIMTEKDAVKCGGLGLKRAWYLTVGVELNDASDTAWMEALADRLKRVEA